MLTRSQYERLIAEISKQDTSLIYNSKFSYKVLKVLKKTDGLKVLIQGNLKFATSDLIHTFGKYIKLSIIQWRIKQ